MASVFPNAYDTIVLPTFTGATVAVKALGQIARPASEFLTELVEAVRATQIVARQAGRADVRNFASSTGGVYGTGNADKDTACIQAAIAEMAEEQDDVLGGPPVSIPAGIAYINDPIVRTSPVPVHGTRMGRTILRTTTDMASKWMWTDDGLNRDGEWTIGADTYDPLVYKGGADLRNLTLLSDRTMSGRYHGYRTLNSCDDLRHEGLMIAFFNGVGYRLGDPSPTDGAGGTVRESAVTDLRVMGCGDQTAGHNAWTITQADAPVSGGDGTNQIDFVNPWFVTNWGRGYVGTGSSSEVLRRVTFSNMMLHGLTASAMNDHLMVVEGRASGIAILGLRTNSSSLNKACIHWKEKNGFVPALQQVTGFHASNMEGSLFSIADVDSLDLQGSTGPGGIDQYEVTVAADSTATPGSPAVGSGRFSIVTGSASRKMNIPANSAANINVINGRPLRKAATTAQLTSATDLVNTYGKQAGTVVFNTTTGKPVWALGAGATAHWVDATSSDVHTPS